MNFSKFGRSRAGRLFILTLILPAVFVACDRSESKTPEAANNKSPEPAITVTQARAEARQIPAFIQATGSLVAEEVSDIAPKVAGKVVNVSVNVGQFVTEGSLIAKIDDKDARLRLAESKASVTQSIVLVRVAEARLGLSPKGSFNASMIPEVRAASANYDQYLAELKQAEANEKRYRELVETGDAAMITYETYRTTRDTARARANNAKQNLEAVINTARQNNQGLLLAQANVDTARTQVAAAEQAITDTIVRAPFSGFISNRPVAVGEYVSSASVIATILRTNPIKVHIQIAESDVPYIGIGRGVSIQVDAYKDRNFGGSVTAVNPSVETNSRSAIVEAKVGNSDNALRVGMFATAKITRDGESLGVFVPKDAVLNDQTTQSQRVFVIVEGFAKLRTVQLGTEENGAYQILNGVNADEMVATSNLEQLYEGAKITPQ